MKKPCLIAEIGINHNGDINIAKQLIKNAKDCEFDAVSLEKDRVSMMKGTGLSKRKSLGQTTREQKLGLGLKKKSTMK